MHKIDRSKNTNAGGSKAEQKGQDVRNIDAHAQRSQRLQYKCVD